MGFWQWTASSFAEKAHAPPCGNLSQDIFNLCLAIFSNTSMWIGSSSHNQAFAPEQMPTSARSGSRSTITKIGGYESSAYTAMEANNKLTKWTWVLYVGTTMQPSEASNVGNRGPRLLPPPKSPLWPLVLGMGLGVGRGAVAGAAVEAGVEFTAGFGVAVGAEAGGGEVSGANGEAGAEFTAGSGIGGGASAGTTAISEAGFPTPELGACDTLARAWLRSDRSTSL
mmetsp:Transcript_28076/g.79089  ORF Transcript_28076/g.79089 Transcript_28076/m.79089 type:complete len:226 (+) Transcript_28076:638-1315(+)